MRSAIRLLFVVFGVLFCFTDSWAVACKAKPPSTLGDNLGLLAVDVDSPTPINAIRIKRNGSLFGGETLTDLPTGSSTCLIALPAGSYAWARIDLRIRAYLRVDEDPQFQFKIEPGVMNYVGDLNVAPSMFAGRYRIEVINRSARFLIKLDHLFPGVRHKYALRYQGAFPDQFLQFAATELGDQSAANALMAGSANTPAYTPNDVDPALKNLATELFSRPQVSNVRLSPDGDLVAMIEYRDKLNHIALLDTRSHFAVDLYSGTGEVEDVYFAGERTVIFTLAGAVGYNNFVNHITTRAGAAPTFTHFVIPDRVAVIDPLPDDGEHAVVVHSDSLGSVHLFNINLNGKRFNTSQFYAGLRLDKGLDNAYAGLTDASGTLRVAMTNVDGDDTMMYRVSATSPWHEVRKVNVGEVFTPVMLDDAGDSLIALTNAGRSQTDLVRVTLPSGNIAETLFSVPWTDIDGVLKRGGDRHILGVTYFRNGKLQTGYLDNPDNTIGASIAHALPGKSIVIYDRSKDQKRMLILASDEIDPGTFYLFDAALHQLQKLESFDRSMPNVHGMRSQLLRIKTNDGKSIESYLTLPYQTPLPFPLVVMPHGGPIGVRDSLDFDPEVQLLANRGYAVLRVNYRGSSGFGSAFEHAGFGAWGKGIEEDILAAIDAAQTAAPIDPERIALRGGSYGGYSALMGLIETPHRFRCGVAISAVTDLPLLFTSSDWSRDKALRAQMKKMVGDPTKALDAMQSLSPDYLYRKLDRPLLIVHGGIDRRVPLEHALRLLLLLGHANKPPQLLYLSGEGHGITGLADKLRAETVIDKFLSSCLQPKIGN